MAKCKGSKEDGSVCGRPTMYKSDYCKNHRDQDSSIRICMGKSGSGPCTLEVTGGELYCRKHRTQIADFEKLQCPRGCGFLSYKYVNPERQYYHCKECKGINLDAKSVQGMVTSSRGKDQSDTMMEELLESSDQSSLKCPNCETLMLEFRLEYKPGTDHGDFDILDSGTRHHRRNMRLLKDLGPLGMVLGAAMVVNEISKEMEDDEQVGSRASIVLDGCRECGSFWLDGGERETIQMTSDFIGTSGAAIAEQEKLKREEERVFEEAQERRRLTNCLHIDKRNGKSCRKVTFRSTDYCLEHQLK